MNGLFELLTNKAWMVSPEYLQSIRYMIQRNLTDHVALQTPDKVMGYPVSVDGTRILHDNGMYHKVQEPFINLEIINGPVTRNGDACSFGSVHHRDMMMRAADSPYCVGHIFKINTPGGSAWAKNDYQQAIDYAHSKGQKVYAFIDGMCCSAGMYLAAMCDGRYYMNPNDQIGCIGVLAAFFTLADGEKNKYTNETYHEIYDPESFDKNRTWRDIANDGDTKKYVEELAELGVEFRDYVKKACPNAKEEHLHGKVFKAEEVKGILMDEQKNLAEVIALFSKDAKAVEKRTSTVDPMEVAKALAKGGVEMTAHILPNYKQVNIIDMKEKFPELFAALEVKEVLMEKDGAFMNMDLLATLNAAIVAKNKEAADAKALVENLTTEKANLEQQLADKTAEIDTLKADHEKAVADLKAEHASAIEEKDNAISAIEQEKADLQSDIEGKQSQIDALTTENAEAKTNLETANNTIAERDQQIADLQAQVTELQNEGGEGGEGGSPATNGGSAQSEVAVATYVYDSTLSYDENMRLKAEFEKANK